MGRHSAQWGGPIAGILMILTAQTAMAQNLAVSTSLLPEPRPANLISQTTTRDSFAAWRSDFTARAIAQGISPAVVNAALGGMTPLDEVVRLDGNQSEFVRPIWDYLDSAVSRQRIENGRANYQRYAADLARIEAQFGVPAEVLIAVWGVETSYGSFRGNTDTLRALATLAWEGRRRAYFESELLAALQILELGAVSPRAFAGSWAGAMGHTQFMPTSYLAYAIDYTGDGRADIWGEDPRDALASAAHYLSEAGWQRGQPWALEIALPQGFDYRLAGRDKTRGAAFWRSQSVTLADGSRLPDHGQSAILLPAGARGVALMVYDNFRALERYNPADSYVIALGHLSDRIAGHSNGFRATWPRNDHVLTRSERTELQTRLTAAGFDTGGVDGRIGPKTMAAIRSYQIANGLLPDGYASSDLLRRLQ
ncbi:lytic murein transglycosylase [Rhodobacteraceae bacterium XHP0102]|nr:lytic murein transglycosylase [Rhodobacteraceae bacterium XHP0102]